MNGYKVHFRDDDNFLKLDFGDNAVVQSISTTRLFAMMRSENFLKI